MPLIGSQHATSYFAEMSAVRHGRQTVRMAGGARLLDTGERRVLDLLLVEDACMSPRLNQRALESRL